MYPNRNYPCDICQENSYTSIQRQRHKAQVHYCYGCKKYFLDKSNHICRSTQTGLGTGSGYPSGSQANDFQLVQAGLETFQVYSLITIGTFFSVEKVVRKYKTNIERLLELMLTVHKNIKARLVIQANLVQQRTGETKEHNLGSLYSIVLNKSEIRRFIFDQTSRIIRKLNFYNTGGSSWSVASLPRIDLHIAKFVPLKGGIGIPTPSCYRNKQGLINIPTRENLCFPYCAIACYLNIKTQKEGERIKIYKQFLRENFNDISGQCSRINFMNLPQEDGVTVDDIRKFTSDNSSFSVNVYGHDEESESIFPVQLTKEEKQFHMDLLLLTDADKDISHYVLIRDFDLFMKKKNNHKRFYCKRCLQSFASPENVVFHLRLCSEYPPQRLVFPSVAAVNYELGANEIQHAFWVSADFETIMKPMIDEPAAMADGKMKRLSRHVALSYAYAYVGGGKVDHWRYYDRQDPDKHFIQEMLKLADYHLEKMSVHSETMLMSRADWMNFVTSSICVLCKKEFEEEDQTIEVEGDEVGEIDDGCSIPKRLRGCNLNSVTNPSIRVRHHYHGDSHIQSDDNSLLYRPAKYRGTAHLNCNLQFKARLHLTVVLHNLGNFDSKLILEGCQKAGVTDINILAKSSERILSLSIGGKLRFIDSQLHLNQSLASLSETLKRSGTDKFVCTKQMIPNKSEQQYNLILSKQAFPYEYVTQNNLDIPSDVLPARELFFSSIKNATVSQEDYDIASKVYRSFNCKSLRDYLRLYNKLDVGILADVIEEHRKQCMEMYKVDPLNFLTLPSVAFNVGMSESKQTLEYIREVDLYLEVKKATRGGVVNFSSRHAKANIPSQSDFDSSKPELHISQLDINSLYSFAMTKSLPTGNYRRMTDEEIATFDIQNIDEDGPKGYLLNVDITVPDDKELHDFLKDLPPLPERVIINEEQSSQTQQRISAENKQLKHSFGAEQYLCTLFDKKSYSAFIPSLKQALDVGLKVEKINYGWEFDQRPFVREFALKNVKARADANCESRKQTLKLILNAFYGRTAIDTSKFRSFFIVTDHIRAGRLVRQSNFKSATIINEGMVLIEMRKTTNYANNHCIVGAAILDIARAYFYRVWYTMKRKFMEKIQLIYTDTDSYLFTLETNSLLEDLKGIQVDGEQIMDFSYLPDDELFRDYKSNKFKGKVGKLKSETNEKEILEVVVLKKKQYALRIEGDENNEKLRSKGLAHAFLKQYSFETYKRTLFEGDIVVTKIKMLRSIHMQLYNIQMKRLSFTPMCCSRFLLLPVGIDTLPFGHYSIIDGTIDTVLEDNL